MQDTRYQRLVDFDFADTVFLISMNNLANTQKNGTLEVRIPRNTCGGITYEAKNVKYIDENDFVWYGEVESEDTCICNEGYLLFISKHGERFGHMTIDNESYAIHDLGGGVNALVRLAWPEDTDIDECAYLVQEERVSRLPRPFFSTRNFMQCDVRVLCLYTPAALEAKGITQTTGHFSVRLRLSKFLKLGKSILKRKCPVVWASPLCRAR